MYLQDKELYLLVLYYKEILNLTYVSILTTYKDTYHGTGYVFYDIYKYCRHYKE